jgi:coproporphyrinogen III oxidase
MKYQKKIHENILSDTKSLRAEAELVFKRLRDNLCENLESFEKNSLNTDTKFHINEWTRNEGGGGVSSILRGSIIEKAGVHLSTVYGMLPSGALNDQKSKESDFWASGISVIIHPQSPFIPSAHLNLRMIVTDKYWFGGGADLTPMLEIKRSEKDRDTVLFHKYLKSACQNSSINKYDKFKENCDAYFHIKHRNENRGTGGIFFDNYKSKNSNMDLLFLNQVGDNFIEAYKIIIKDNIDKAWTEKEKQEQLHFRGRYVEFNLMYDKGTLFGLKTGGNIDSILSSLPPLVSW